jgi:SAM-dependent methyltransferase
MHPALVSFRRRGWRLPHNVLLDRAVRAVPAAHLGALRGVELGIVELGRAALERWVDRHVPDWRIRFGRPLHNKLVQFFTSFALLEPRAEHAFLDAAGGIHTYLPALPCRARYLQDVQISRGLRQQLGPDVAYVEGDAGRIPLAAESIDRIACHHSFEHFQGDGDVRFVREVQRLLAPGGRCCIVPLFVGDRYAEVTDAFTLSRKFDRRSRRVIDPTASLPGGRWCGNYARIYDVQAVAERLLASIDLDRFRVSVREVRVDGRPVPDLSDPRHRHVTAVNHPYRALVIERR